MATSKKIATVAPVAPVAVEAPNANIVTNDAAIVETAPKAAAKLYALPLPKDVKDCPESYIVPAMSGRLGGLERWFSKKTYQFKNIGGVNHVVLSEARAKAIKAFDQCTLITE